VHVINLEIAIRNELHALWINSKINLAYLQNALDKSLSVFSFEIVDDSLIHWLKFACCVWWQKLYIDGKFMTCTSK
jgi:hypothetical protein